MKTLKFGFTWLINVLVGVFTGGGFWKDKKAEYNFKNRIVGFGFMALFIAILSSIVAVW